MMKVLVTGGCGFIGSHLVDTLVDNGYEVINVDDQSASNEQFYINNKAKNYNFSITETERLIKISDGCEYIFHLAAESRLQQATENPQKAVNTNIGGTLSVLECCKKHGIGIAFSSTSSVYGNTDQLPITEDHRENCMNPYASTKYAAELLIRNYNTLHGVPATIFRYFNVFGERAPAFGQYALVTSIFLNQKKNNLPLTVVGDGSQKRDFIYVKDIVNANILAFKLHKTVPDIANATPYNIGSGTEVSVLELANAISDNIVFIEKRKGEALNNLCSNEKFFAKTGWTPTVSILDWIEDQI
jgi:UDP-glucose 4-epimerase